MIVFDLNQNNADALLRHVDEFKPQTGDALEDARLRDALVNRQANGSRSIAE